MPISPLKITYPTKIQEDIKLNEETQSIDASTEMTNMSWLSEKDFGTAMIKKKKKKCFSKQLWTYSK